jgi:hypothetical protein
MQRYFIITNLVKIRRLVAKFDRAKAPGNEGKSKGQPPPAPSLTASVEESFVLRSEAKWKRPF